jgi:NAD(P)-dependent dehydrogenase (short-subunit alcohol dehydrogenase family)
MESSSLSKNKVAVITGSSTGIGYETALVLAKNGFLTYATVRNLNKGYLAGSDVETWLGGKRKVADEEFYKMMKQNMIM